MTDPTETTRQLLRRAESYLSALHGSVARHDNLAANLGCAGCELRDQIQAVLAAVSSVVLPLPADRPAVLREAADELGRMDYDTDSNDYGYDTYRDAWNGGVMDGADLLRRLAAAAPQSGQPKARCGRDIETALGTYACERDADHSGDCDERTEGEMSGTEDASATTDEPPSA
jgi:hypothetical protein